MNFRKDLLKSIKKDKNIKFMDGIRNRYITKILIYLSNFDNHALNVSVNSCDLYLTRIENNLYSLDCYIFNMDDIIEINRKHTDFNIIIKDNDINLNYINESLNNQIYNPKYSENTFSTFKINFNRASTSITLFLEKRYYKTWLINYLNIFNGDIIYLIKLMLFNLIYLPNIKSHLLNILINNINLHLTKIDHNLYSLDCYLFNVNDKIMININSNICIPKSIFINKDNRYSMFPPWYNVILDLIDVDMYSTYGRDITLFLEKKYYKTWLIKYLNILNEPCFIFY